MNKYHMQCPSCADATRVEINLKSDGFSKRMFECGSCGTLWTFKHSVEDIVILNDHLSLAR